MPTNIGKRRYRVEIQRNEANPEAAVDSADRDSLGQVIDDWQTVATRQAELVPRGKMVKGGEAWYGQQVSAELAMTFSMRCWVDEDGVLLPTNCRLKLGSRIFEILNVVNPGERRGTTEMIVYCQEPLPPEE